MAARSEGPGKAAGSAMVVDRGLDYAPAPESRDVVSIAPEYGLFVNGEFGPARSGKTFATVNTATEATLSKVARAGGKDVDRAVAAAHIAYDNTWGPMPGAERAEYLYRIARILQERAREFAVLESIDNGKPIKETRDVEVPLAAAHFSTTRARPTNSATPGSGSIRNRSASRARSSRGTSRLLMAAWKLAPALAAGNTCVLKPALTALLLAEVCQQAELPPGVVNVLTGARDTGAALVAHPGIDKVAFTGSTEVGKAIAEAIGGTGKKLTLELGSKAANVVFDDASVEQAIEGIVNGIFFNQGHVCCAGSRLLVQESVAEHVTERLRRRLETLRLGDPLDKNTDIGAINSREQFDKITELSAAGEAEGAQRWSPACQLPAKGFWFAPDRVHRGQPVAPDRPRGDLRPSAVRTDVPHPRTSRGQGEQHRLRAVRRGLDREMQPHPVDGAEAAGRGGLGQHLQPVRPGQPVRRLPGVGIRAGGRPARARRIPRCLIRSSNTPTAELPALVAASSGSARPTSYLSAARSRVRSQDAPTPSMPPRAAAALLAWAAQARARTSGTKSSRLAARKSR